MPPLSRHYAKLDVRNKHFVALEQAIHERPQHFLDTFITALLTNPVNWFLYDTVVFPKQGFWREWGGYITHSRQGTSLLFFHNAIYAGVVMSLERVNDSRDWQAYQLIQKIRDDIISRTPPTAEHRPILERICMYKTSAALRRAPAKELRQFTENAIFYLGAHAYMALLDQVVFPQGHTIIAAMHTHPNTVPFTPQDIAEHPTLPQLLVAFDNNKHTAQIYTHHDGRTQETPALTFPLEDCSARRPEICDSHVCVELRPQPIFRH